jgi:hypothetical protein
MHNNLTILISLLPETTVNPFNILDFFSGLYKGDATDYDGKPLFVRVFVSFTKLSPCG